METQDLVWIDDFVESIREYVYVREKDDLLILVPNQAYKLNRTGIVLLKNALAGKSVRDTLADRGVGADTAVAQDVHEFFCDLRALVMGCLGEGEGRRAVDTVPFERPHNLLPVLSEIAVTYRCNLACRFCYVGCNCTRQSVKREMTTDEVKRVLDRIRFEAEVPSVSWTGGEPLLRDDLVELTRHATGIGMRVNLITNGTLVSKELAHRLAEAGLKSAQVSLEAPDAETHDALTQVKGSFDQTVRGIDILRDAGLHVHTNTTVNSDNIGVLDGMFALARRLELTRLSMNMAIPCGSAPGSGVTVAYDDMPEFVERMRKTGRREGIQFMWYSPTPYCIYNPVAAGLGGKSCAACDGLLSVTPEGNVIPCSSLPQPVGNLLRSSFERVWNSRKALYWRDKRYAHGICRKCASFDLCLGACPIYWDAKGYGELKRARRLPTDKGGLGTHRFPPDKGGIRGVPAR